MNIFFYASFFKKFLFGLIFIMVSDLIFFTCLHPLTYRLLKNVLKTPREILFSYPFAIFSWSLLIIGILIFVLPFQMISMEHAIAYGAFFGFIVYGIYELTNLAILKEWSYIFALIDIIWGVCITALATLFLIKI